MDQLQIEQITRMVLDALNSAQDRESGYAVPIGVSARHVHLTKEHVETLFGKGYELTKKKDLMGGQFAAADRRRTRLSSESRRPSGSPVTLRVQARSPSSVPRVRCT